MGNLIGFGASFNFAKLRNLNFMSRKLIPLNTTYKYKKVKTQNLELLENMMFLDILFWIASFSCNDHKTKVTNNAFNLLEKEMELMEITQKFKH